MKNPHQLKQARLMLASFRLNFKTGTDETGLEKTGATQINLTQIRIVQDGAR
jgi:hypothetical protein